MPIIGVTHDEAGEARQSLSVAIKVAIGLGPDPEAGRKAPKKLDHFVFLRKVGAELEWKADERLTKHYREKCKGNPREVAVILLSDETENVFRTQYAWWTATQRKCWSEMVEITTVHAGANAAGFIWRMQATRRTEKNPDGELWAPPNPCGPGCPDLERGDCKPSGDLYFVLADFPMLGEVCRLHTSGYSSVRQLSSSIEQVRRLTGGRLTGMRLMLRVRPERVTYKGKDGKHHRTTIFALSLGVSEDDMRKLLAGMTEYAQMFESTRRLLGGQPPIEYEVEETERERAPEIAAEFHPTDPEQQDEPEPPKTEIGTLAEQKAAGPFPLRDESPKHAPPPEEKRNGITFRSDGEMVWLSGPALAFLVREMPAMNAKKNEAGEPGIAVAWFGVFEQICKDRGIELHETKDDTNSSERRMQRGAMS